MTAKALSKASPRRRRALAQKIGFENLEELRDVITRQMQREYDGMSRMRIKRDLLDALAERGRASRCRRPWWTASSTPIWQRVEADLKAGKLDEEDKGKDEETLKAEYRAIAERRVRLGLLLAEIGRTNGIQVTADEMTRAMRAEAASTPARRSR